MRARAEREGRPVTGGAPDDVARVIDWLVEGGVDAVELSGREVVSRDVVSRLRPDSV
jgi:hypothetical protein